MNLTGTSRLRRWVRTSLIVFSVAIYTLLAPVGYALFTLLVRIPTRTPERRARCLQRVVGAAFSGFHHWLRWLRILDFDPRPLRNQLPSGPFVVVANHPTLTDATAVLSAVPNLCTAVRSDLFHKPSLQPLLSGAGHFDAGTDNPLASLGLLEHAVERLHQGFRVLIFPEGTRSNLFGLRRFGRSAFEAATRARVPIVALLITERPTYLAKGGRLFGPPSELPVKRLKVLEIIDPSHFSEDTRALRDYVEASYRQALGLRSSAEAASSPVEEAG